jgi:hypothetical protein
LAPKQVGKWRIVNTLTTLMVANLDRLEIAIQAAKIFPSCARWVETVRRTIDTVIQPETLRLANQSA